MFHKWILSAYSPVNHPDYKMVKAVCVTLMLLIPLLLLILASGNLIAPASYMLEAMISLFLTVLIVIRLGYYGTIVPVLIIGCNLMVAALIFSLPYHNPYQVYMLATFFLFLLFVSILITHDLKFAYITAGVSSVSLILHYLIRSVTKAGSFITPNLDDYTVCLGLLFISFVMIKYLANHRQALLKTAEDAAAKNIEKAAQLKLANEKLLSSNKELRKAEQKYRILVETATDAIFIAQEGMIRFANPRTSSMFGYTAEELVKKPLHELIHPMDRTMVMERHRLRLEGENPPTQYSFRVIDKSGEFLWVQLDTVLVSWENEPATLNFMRDITQQKNFEIQYRHTQKMEAIGTMAGGIAHDFNNILSGMFGFIQLARKNIKNSEKTGMHLEQLNNCARKASDLVQQILMVSRQTNKEKQHLKLSSVVDEALILLRASMPLTIDIQKHLISEKRVWADPVRLHQVIMNLCTNAHHAMLEKGGTLSVSLKEVQISRQESNRRLNIRPGRYLKLSVADTGHGMGPEIQKKIFDPYFTTKPVGKGTGLGLSMVLGIAEEHNGYISVDSEPGIGTTFHFFLPVSEKDDPAGEAPETEEMVEGGSDRIMVVDDDPDIRISMKGLLEDYGYRINPYSSAVDAFEAYQKDPNGIDLIITDMNMPGMTGWEFAQKVLAMNSDQKIFLSTGYSESMNREKAVSSGITGYLEKPMAAENLLRVIRSALDTKKR